MTKSMQAREHFVIIDTNQAEGRAAPRQARSLSLFGFIVAGIHFHLDLLRIELDP